MKKPAPIPTAPGLAAGPGWLRRWKRLLDESLSFRLWALGLAPLLLAFPVVLLVLALLGSDKADTLVTSNLRSHVASAHSYLDQIKGDTLNQLSQLVRSDRLLELVDSPTQRDELQKTLKTTAHYRGLDYLIVATESGQVLASSTQNAGYGQLPDTHVLRQASVGVPSAAYESFDTTQLSAFSEAFPAQAGLEITQGGAQRSRGLVINAAVHFPLNTSDQNTVLVGGILLNRNLALIDHMREIVFPMGTLPDDTEGLTSIHVGTTSVATSRQHFQAPHTSALQAPPEAARAVLDKGQPWMGRQNIGGQSYMVGYEALTDGTGRAVGMISGAFPDAPYQRMTRITLGTIGGLLALTMLAITALFLHTGRELNHRLHAMSETMAKVQSGDRTARVGKPMRNDELGRLSRTFDMLLNTIEAQDRQQQAAQQTIADEVSRRRALFEHERDGVAILSADGAVLEANPKFSEMLGYSLEELKDMRITDWDSRFTQDDLKSRIGQIGQEGKLFETTHRRKDGSTYSAEVSVSRAEWNHQTFVLTLIRDISDRKATEAQLKRLATTDSLTGVLNRGAWSEAAAQLAALARRYRHPLSMLSLDADHFKRLNDRHGHPAGDAVLQALARALKDNLREPDVLGRMGGEEFAIASPETDVDGAMALAERLLQAVRALRVPHDQDTLEFTISIGVAVLQPDSQESLESLYKRVDAALYEAKGSGRDRSCLAKDFSSQPPSSAG